MSSHITILDRPANDSYALTSSVKEALTRRNTNAAGKRVPHPAGFSKLSVIEQIAMIEAVQRELDFLTESVKSGTVTSERRGRSAALRGLRKRQMRLDKLATAFGFRRRWRLHVRAEAGSRPQSTNLN